MTDPRATARQWLAEIIDEHSAMGDSARDIADAILTAPGVYVGEFNISWLAQVDANGVTPPTIETRRVIWLPAEEGAGDVSDLSNWVLGSDPDKS